MTPIPPGITFNPDIELVPTYGGGVTTITAGMTPFDPVPVVVNIDIRGWFGSMQ